MNTQKTFKRTMTSKELNRVVSSFTVYKFVKAMTTSFEDTDAFRLGVIDARGKYLKDPIGKISVFDRLVINLKVLLNMIPDPRIKSQLNYLTTGIGLLAEESAKYGADPDEVFESIMDYFQEQGLDLDQYLEEAKKVKPQAETTGHLEHVGELLYRGSGKTALKHLAATHALLTGKPVKGHELSYKADGSISLVFGKHQGRPYVQYKGKNSPAFFDEKGITDYATTANKPHLVAPFTAALKAASHQGIPADRSYQADAILRDSDTSMKGNLLRYKLPKPSTRSTFAVHSEIDTASGKKIRSNPDLSGLSSDENHFAPLSLTSRKFKMSPKSSKTLGSHIRRASALLDDPEVSGLLDEISKHEDPSSKTGARRIHFKRFGQAVQEQRHPRTAAGFAAFSKAEIAKEKNKKQAARLQSHLDYGMTNKKALAKVLRAHEHIDNARNEIFGTMTKDEMPLTPEQGGSHEGIVSELPGEGQVKFVPPSFTIANKGQKDKFKKKNLKENAMKNQRDLFKNIVKNKLNEKKNEDMEKENDEDEDEKRPSSKKTINISYEPENYKKNRAKSLDNLIAMLMKKEPVNEDIGPIDLDVDADTDAPDEEERKKLLKKIANSLGTGENVAGINPFESEVSKQPSKFKKLFKQMLKKNKTNKEK